jgi:hypothetical protein
MLHHFIITRLVLLDIKKERLTTKRRLNLLSHCRGWDLNPNISLDIEAGLHVFRKFPFFLLMILSRYWKCFKEAT